MGKIDHFDRVPFAQQCIDFRMPTDPLADTAWILLLQRIDAHPTATLDK